MLSVIDDCVGDANGTPELCLSQSDSDEGYLALKCNTGGTSNNYIDMLAKVPASGVIRVTAYPDGKGSGLGRTVYYIQVHHNRTITGYVNDISIYPSAGNEKCVSGKVTFKARLGSGNRRRRRSTANDRSYRTPARTSARDLRRRMGSRVRRRRTRTSR